MQKKSTNDFSPLRNPLIIALDVDSDTQALKLAEKLVTHAGAFKLGPRLIHRYGSGLTEKIAKLAPVFVDCKFFDIPSTMEAAVQSSFDSGASLVTVHALAGSEALQRLSALETKLNTQRSFRILCVTVLTSWNAESLPGNFKSLPVNEHVKILARLARDSGLKGIVCSPQELTELSGQGLYIVTPGIRWEKNSKSDDQKRTMSPAQAMSAGATALVVGRPIIEASDPVQAALDFGLAILGK